MKIAKATLNLLNKLADDWAALTIDPADEAQVEETSDECFFGMLSTILARKTGLDRRALNMWMRMEQGYDWFPNGTHEAWLEWVIEQASKTKLD